MRGSAGYAQVEGTPQPKGRNFQVHLVMVLPQSFGTYRPGSAQCLVLSAARVCVCVSCAECRVCVCVCVEDRRVSQLR